MSSGSTPSLPRIPNQKPATPQNASRPKSGKEKTTPDAKNQAKRVSFMFYVNFYSFYFHLVFLGIMRKIVTV